MIDIKIKLDDNGSFTIDFENGDFKHETGFDTAIYILLFSDAEAPSDRIINPVLRRGWIGDLNSPVENRKFGSLLWLVEQSKLNTDTLNKVIDYVKSALSVFVTDGLCLSVDVDAIIVPLKGIQLNITITTLYGEAINNYVKLWEVTGVN